MALDKLTDKDALDLIERYKWAVSPQCGGGWVVDTSGEPGMDGDADVLEIARTRGSLRDALEMALVNEQAHHVLAYK